MNQVARTCIAAVIAFIVGGFLCWWFTPEQKPAPAAVIRAIRPRPGVVHPYRGTARPSWEEAPEYYECWDLGSGHRRVPLPHEFSTRGDILAWAENVMRHHWPTAYCQDPYWCLVLTSHFGSGAVWTNGLFAEHAPAYASDPRPWKLRWISTGFVGWGGFRWPECAWISRDSRTLVIADRDGKACSISRLPRKVRHL